MKITRKLGLSGSSLGTEFQINTLIPATAPYSAVSGLSSGGCVVAWLGGTYNIYAQYYFANFTVNGETFQVNTDNGLTAQSFPVIAQMTDGGCVISWESNGEGASNYGVYGQRLDSKGNKVGVLTRSPTNQPTGQPTNQPSRQPSGQPTNKPTSQPSDQPSGQPSSQPSRHPSRKPSDQPLSHPSSQPSEQPSLQPSDQPSRWPTSPPSLRPLGQPTHNPSVSNTLSQGPTIEPTNFPTATLFSKDVPVKNATSLSFVVRMMGVALGGSLAYIGWLLYRCYPKKIYDWY